MVTVDAVPTDQSVTVTYTINRAHKAVASQTCTLDELDAVRHLTGQCDREAGENHLRGHY